MHVTSKIPPDIEYSIVQYLCIPIIVWINIADFSVIIILQVLIVEAHCRYRPKLFCRLTT